MHTHAAAPVEQQPANPMLAALQRAVEIAGSQSALARAIGVKQAHVWNWLQSGRVPAEHVLAVEGATAVSRHDLRPDVFGDSPSAPPAQMNAAQGARRQQG